jgi:hypothetical protein
MKKKWTLVDALKLEKMEKIKTPKLKEVRYYFKDADEILSLNGRKFKNYDIFQHGNFHNSIYSENGEYEVWNPKKGYAEIVTYKKKWTLVDALELNEGVKLSDVLKLKKTMNENEQKFEEVVKDTLSNIEKLLLEKGREYRRNGDPYHNFNEGSSITGEIPEKVLDGFLLKHEISIKDMTNDLAKGIIPETGRVIEKFDDNIVYLIIKKAMILQRISNNLNK